MPVYTYKSKNAKKACAHCRKTFEWFHRASDKVLVACPRCGNPVTKVISGFSLGSSKSGFNRKAKEKGFHKLKKVDKGKYEKLY